MVKRTNHAAGTVINQTDNDAPVTGNNIAAIIEVVQTSLVRQHS